MENQEMAAKIYEAIQDGYYEYYGIRIDDDIEYSEGDKTEDSRIWVDGDPTDETLDGTSSIGIDHTDTADEIEAKIEQAKNYYGNKMYLIAGNSVSYGEDAGEYVISNAVVVKVLK